MEKNSRNLPGPSLSQSAGSLKASILIVTVWALFMLATFAVILGYTVRQKLSLAMRLEQRDAARYLSWANIKLATWQIKNKATMKFLVSFPGSHFEQAYSQEQKEDASEQAFTEIPFVIIDEERKININKADMQVLERLVKIVLGYGDIGAQELAAAIVDWRDKDSVLSLPSGSAEDFYYTSLPYPYECKDADFDCLAELLLVKGVTREAFEKLRDYLTVYGDGLININTAPWEVLLALGLSEDLVNNIVYFRCGKDKLPRTEDDNYFTSTSEIAVSLGNFCTLNEIQMQSIESLAAKYLTVESNYFMIETRPSFNQGKNIYQATCVADGLGKVLYWEEM
jgi:type II secretory pathway component PulK